jgi:hypothetical protein
VSDRYSRPLSPIGNPLQPKVRASITKPFPLLGGAAPSVDLTWQTQNPKLNYATLSAQQLAQALQPQGADDEGSEPVGQPETAEGEAPTPTGLPGYALARAPQNMTPQEMALYQRSLQPNVSLAQLMGAAVKLRGG